MRVQDVMTSRVRTVDPSTDAAVALEEMRAAGIHHLVVTRGADVVGVLSGRDSGGRRGAAGREGRTVSDLMSDKVVTVAPETTVRKAANLMRSRSIGSLIVTAHGRIVGIVTVADLLELLGRGADRNGGPGPRWLLRHRAPHRKRAASTAAW